MKSKKQAKRTKPIHEHMVIKSCILLIVGTAICAILICMISTIINNRSITNIPTDSLLMEKAIKKCGSWYLSSNIWVAVEYLCVIIPIEINAAILYLEAYCISDCKRAVIILFSVFSIALIIFSYAVHPHEHVEAYRTAYVSLDDDINMIIANGDYNNTKDDMLANAISKGEHLINRAYNAGVSS